MTGEVQKEAKRTELGVALKDFCVNSKCIAFRELISMSDVRIRKSQKKRFCTGIHQNINFLLNLKLNYACFNRR